MNKVVIIGRLTKDPEVRRTGEDNSMTVAKYTIAVDRRGEGTDYISCVAFGKRGDFAEHYLHKGMKIAVDGHLQTGSYTNKDGVKVYTTDVIVEGNEFCEKKVNVHDGFEEVPDDFAEELPFK